MRCRESRRSCRRCCPPPYHPGKPYSRSSRRARRTAATERRSTACCQKPSSSLSRFASQNERADFSVERRRISALATRSSASTSTSRLSKRRAGGNGDKRRTIASSERRREAEMSCSRPLAILHDARTGTRTRTPLRERDFKLCNDHLAKRTKPHHTRNHNEVAQSAMSRKRAKCACSHVCEGTPGGQCKCDRGYAHPTRGGGRAASSSHEGRRPHADQTRTTF